MLGSKKSHWKIILLAGLLFVSLVLAGFWLKSAYSFTQPSQIAEKFVALLQKGDFQLAHEMTLKNKQVGTSASELREISARQLCAKGAKLERVSISPLQTNGNRIRRWLSGIEVEMPEIRVEFENASCLFNVSLHHEVNGQWKVFSFQSHSG